MEDTNAKGTNKMDRSTTWGPWSVPHEHLLGNFASRLVRRRNSTSVSSSSTSTGDPGWLPRLTVPVMVIVCWPGRFGGRRLARGRVNSNHSALSSIPVGCAWVSTMLRFYSVLFTTSQKERFSHREVTATGVRMTVSFLPIAGSSFITSVHIHLHPQKPRSQQVTCTCRSKWDEEDNFTLSLSVSLTN